MTMQTHGTPQTSTYHHIPAGTVYTNALVISDLTARSARILQSIVDQHRQDPHAH
jgi:hypothetical protein